MKRLTIQKRTHALRLAKAGLTQARIARAIGCSQSAVCKLLRKAGWTRRSARSRGRVIAISQLGTRENPLDLDRL